MENGIIAKKKKSTIITIADELGVSPSTVSRAFNPKSKISNEARQRILQCAKRQNYVPNRTASRLSMREINIGVVYTSFYDLASDEFAKGIRDAYRELFDLKINLEFETLNYTTRTSDNLREILSRWENFDGVIVSGLSDPDEIAILNRYAKINRNIVLLQADIPEVDKLFVSCHDPAVSSRMAAEFIADCLKFSPRKDVVIFTGERRTGLHTEANDVFIRAAEELGLNVVGSFDMKDSPEMLKWQLYEMYVKQGMRPAGVYITSGKSIELCKFIKENELSERTVLVTFDVYPELNEYLKSGVITATIYQNLYKQAKNAFINLVKYVIGQIDVGNFISPAPELVLKSNLDFYIR